MVGLGLLALIALLAPAGWGQEANLVANGGFEEEQNGAPVGWRVMAREGDGGVVADAPAEGAKALRLSGSGRRPTMCVSTPLPVQAGATYLLRWRCRTEGVSQIAYASAAAGRKRMVWDGAGVSGTMDWQERASLLTVGPDATELSLQLVGGTRGTAWFDDVRLSPHERPSSPSPGMERCTFFLGDRNAADVWYNWPLLKVYPDDPLPPGLPQVGSAQIKLARREREALQLLLRPKEPLTVRDVLLKGAPEGIRVSWRVVDWVTISAEAVHDVDGRAGVHPDPLLPPHEAELPAGKLSALWVEVETAADCPAGEHETTLRVEGPRPIEVPLRVTVWDFTLPAQPTITHIAGHNLRSLDRMDPRGGVEAEPELLALFRRHGLQSNRTLQIRLDGVEWVRLADEGVEIDWEVFDAAVEDQRANGFSYMTLLPVNMRARGPGGKSMRRWLGLTPEDEGFAPAFEDYWRQLAAHLKERDWLADAAAYLWDEPNAEEYEAYKALVGHVRRAAPELRLACAGPDFPAPGLYGFVDIWTTNLRRIGIRDLMDRIRERQAAGDEIGAYGNNRYQLQYPLTYMRSWQWLLYRYGLQHTGWWSVNAWRGNPWEQLPNATQQPGSGFLLYPAPAEGYGFTTSLRWEAMHEGMEDYEYLVLYAQKVGADKARELANEVVWGSWDQEFERDVTKLEAAREKMAAAIAGQGQPAP